jgi:thiopeptide-type bacteriocin biosynthesis protein
VALEPAGAEQDESWRQTLTRYGEHLRSRPSADAAVPPEHCLESLMHMHCNRLLGVDREAERYAHALAGDVARAYLGRLRAHS